jgi:hypothetical protein
MGLKRSKKGIIFSLISLGLATLFILIFSTSYDQPADGMNSINQARIFELDQAITGAFVYASHAQEVAGAAALEALYQEIMTNGHVFLPDFETGFLACMQNGTGCANPTNLTALMDNYTVAIDKTLGSTMTITVTGMNITEEGYWHLTVRSTVNVTLHDRYANWETVENVTTSISIIGAKDPLYLRINDVFGGTETRTILRNDIEHNNSQWNLSTFMDFAAGKYYHTSRNGACLSERFEGEWVSTKTGCRIESVVLPQDQAGLRLTLDDLNMDYQTLSLITAPCPSPTEVNPRFMLAEGNLEIVLSLRDMQAYGIDMDKASAPGCT